MQYYKRPRGGEPEHARHPEDPLLHHLGPRRSLGIATTITTTTTTATTTTTTDNNYYYT